MNNDELLEITTEIGWRLLQSGAEIYRVEESIRRMLEAYGFPEAEVFSIPSCIIVTINDETGHALTDSSATAPPVWILTASTSSTTCAGTSAQKHRSCRSSSRSWQRSWIKRITPFGPICFLPPPSRHPSPCFTADFFPTALLPSSSVSFCSYYCPFWETFIPTAFSRTSLAVRWLQGFRCGRRQWAGLSAMTR